MWQSNLKLFSRLQTAARACVVVGAGVLFVSGPLGAQDAFDRGVFAETVDSLAEAFLRDGPVAGAAIGVEKGGELILAKGYGLAEIEHNVPMTVEGVFRIGSISKQFVAVAILQMVEQGKLSLDDPITRFIPDYPTQGHEVTVHHLLTHTSGIVSYTGMGEAFWERSRLDLSHEEMVELFGHEPFEFAPGERWQYNNSGYYLLGMIVERLMRSRTISDNDPFGSAEVGSGVAAGLAGGWVGRVAGGGRADFGGSPLLAVPGRAAVQYPRPQEADDPSYAEYLEENIFGPLGMTTSSYCDETAIVPNRAEGYEVAATGLVNDEPLSMNLPGAAGALCSSVLDLLRWQRALDSDVLISSESRALMLTEATLSDGSGTGYGYGLGLGDFSGHRRVAHGGGINGFSTMLATYPDDDLVVTVLTNTAGSGPGALEAQIARLALGLPLEVTQDLPLDDVDLSRYVGTYVFGDAGVEADIAVRDDQLWIVSGQLGERRLRYQGADTFMVLPGLLLVFQPDASPPAELRTGGEVIPGVRQPG